MQSYGNSSAGAGLLMFALLGALALAPPVQAGQAVGGLAQALQKPMPAGGLDVIVMLRADDLPAEGPGLRSAVAARQSRVLEKLPPQAYGVKRRYESLSGIALRANRGAIEALLRDPEVETVYLDGRVRKKMAQGVPLVGGDTVHARGYTGLGVNVAVLDTGVDTNHPDIVDDLVAEHCVCDDHPSPSRGCCPNDRPTQTGSGAAEDDEGHGTSTAGIITSGGVVASPGIAPDSGIIAVKVLNDVGSGSFSDIDAALDWVLTNRLPLNIKIVNMSLGDDGQYNNPASFPCTGSLTTTAITNLKNAGSPVFVSSGNEGYDNGINFPACVPAAISVGGVYDANVGSVSWCGNASCSQILCTDNPTAADVFVCHTNSDEILDILAPNYATAAPALGGGVDPGFGGTSASSPYAAGEAALLYQIDPFMLPTTVLALMKANGPPVTNPGNGLAFTRTDISAVVDALIGPEPSEVPALPIRGSLLFLLALLGLGVLRMSLRGGLKARRSNPPRARHS